MSEETAQAASEEPRVESGESEAGAAAVIYDARENNRFEYEVESGGLRYDTAHIFGRLGDERYIEYLEALKMKGNDTDVTEESDKAGMALWRDTCIDVENIEKPAGEDWKALIPYAEQMQALNDFLAVAIIPAEEKAGATRRLQGDADSAVITTECWFNGATPRQKHTLKARTPEWKKKFDRIIQKQWKRETTRGLKRKPRIEYVPQDEAFGKLYDEMKISAEGFAGDVIPLRFKVRVIAFHFGDPLDAKK